MAINSVKEIFGGMPAAFNGAAAKGINATFQFEITGEGGVMGGKLKLTGNMMLAQKIQDLFKF